MIKVKKRKILLLPGDGIGPEVIGEVKKIINWFNDKKSLDFEIDEDLAGCLLYTSPSPRDVEESRMPSSA